jgi:hypothetical protein
MTRAKERLMNTYRKMAMAAALLGTALSGPAFADAITLDSSSIGQSFSLNFDGFSDGNTISGLTGSATFTLTGITSTGYQFDYSVSNTSGSGVTSRISSFAFDVDPTIDSASSTGDFGYAVLNSKYPNGIGSVDVCFKGGGSNSCGGNSGGVATGDTGSGTLTLGFGGTTPDEITLSDFYVRYQSITGAGNVTSASGAGSLASSTSGGSTSGGTPVPEPGVLGMFGLGLIGLGFMRRRRLAAVAHA